MSVGDTVTWTNTGGSHTVTSTGNWDSGVLGMGATFSRTFDTPGTFNYFCTIHGAASMSGRVTVSS